jgi:hypothetical protein
LSHGTCSYICMYINAAAKSVILYLHDFYNTIFKIKRKLYITSGSAPPPPRKNSGCAHGPAWPTHIILLLFITVRGYFVECANCRSVKNIFIRLKHAFPLKIPNLLELTQNGKVLKYLKQTRTPNTPVLIPCSSVKKETVELNTLQSSYRWRRNNPRQTRNKQNIRYSAHPRSNTGMKVNLIIKLTQKDSSFVTTNYPENI